MIWSSEDITGLPHPWVVILIIVLDLILGDPRWLYHHIPHPVTVMGSLLSFLEKAANRDSFSAPDRRALGMAVLTLYLGLIFALALGLNRLFDQAAPSVWMTLLYLLLASIFIASRSLMDHVRAIIPPLEENDLPAARWEVSQIVGRDTSGLDASAIGRATIESLAENFSDGVMAPLFWFLVAGLPGLILYKAINTADSMIGHKSARYLYFGWAAARLDDLVNYIPARLTALLIILAALFSKSASSASAARTCWRDAPLHVSPNAGWPEAAVAGALGLRLGGPRTYDGGASQHAWLGDGEKNVTSGDIKYTLRLVLICICMLCFFLFPGGVHIF